MLKWKRVWVSHKKCTFRHKSICKKKVNHEVIKIVLSLALNYSFLDAVLLLLGMKSNIGLCNAKNNDYFWIVLENLLNYFIVKYF